MRKFWVEENPPLRTSAPFNLEPRSLPEDDSRQWLIQSAGGSNRILVIYNTNHPSYKKAANMSRNRKYSPTERYLKDISVLAALYIKIEDISLNGDDYQADQFQPLSSDFLNKKKEPHKQFQEINDYISKVRRQIDEERG